MDEAHIPTYVFHSLDDDNNGSVNTTILPKLCVALYGDYYSYHGKDGYLKLSQDPGLIKIMKSSGKLTIDDFVRLSNDYPSMLLPLYIMRSTLRKNILGGKQWDIMAEDRQAACLGQYYSVSDILMYEGIFEQLQLHVNKVQPTIKSRYMDARRRLSLGNGVEPRRRSIFQSLLEGAVVVRQRSKDLTRALSVRGNTEDASQHDAGAKTSIRSRSTKTYGKGLLTVNKKKANIADEETEDGNSQIGGGTMVIKKLSYLAQLHEYYRQQNDGGEGDVKSKHNTTNASTKVAPHGSTTSTTYTATNSTSSDTASAYSHSYSGRSAHQQVDAASPSSQYQQQQQQQQQQWKGAKQVKKVAPAKRR